MPDMFGGCSGGRSTPHGDASLPFIDPAPLKVISNPSPIIQMKRHQKTFSVEIKRSRTQGQRQHLPPRRLFATLPDETSPFIQKAEPQAVAEPGAAPRILPSILAAVPTSSEAAMPARRKQALRSKADRGQIAFALDADPTGTGKEEAPDLPPTPEAGSQTDIAPAEEESTTPVHAVPLQDVQRSETKARTRRKKASEFVDPVETSQPVAAPMPVEGDLIVSATGVVTSQKACCRRLTKRQAAAVQLPRNERWKRRLHPAAW